MQNCFNYTVRHKNTPKFVYHNLKKCDPILINLNTNISDTTGHQIWFSFPPYSMSVSAQVGGKNEQKIAF